MAKIDPSKIHATVEGPPSGPWRGTAAYSLRVDTNVMAHEIVHVVVNAAFPLEEQSNHAAALEEARTKGRDHIHQLIRQYRADSGEQD